MRQFPYCRALRRDYSCRGLEGVARPIRATAELGRERRMTAGLLTGQGMPSREGDLSIEGHGMDPIPESARYGSVTRVFTVWFTPNLVPAAFFLGTLAAAGFIGLGFWTAVAAIAVGNFVGSILVGLLATMGPKTGMAQMPLARLAYGKSIVVPGLDRKSVV